MCTLFTRTRSTCQYTCIYMYMYMYTMYVHVATPKFDNSFLIISRTMLALISILYTTPCTCTLPPSLPLFPLPSPFLPPFPSPYMYLPHKKFLTILFWDMFSEYIFLIWSSMVLTQSPASSGVALSNTHTFPSRDKTWNSPLSSIGSGNGITTFSLYSTEL